MASFSQIKHVIQMHKFEMVVFRVKMDAILRYFIDLVILLIIKIRHM